MKIFTEEPNEYEQALIKWLFRVWMNKPDSYTDANGVSMSMNIESEFQRVLGKDVFSGVPVINRQVKTMSVNPKTFIEIEISEMFNRAHLRLTKEQAQMLVNLIQMELDKDLPLEQF